MSYKSTHLFEFRKSQADCVLARYPDRFPIICEKANHTDRPSTTQSLPELEKSKFLVPATLSFGGFIVVLRRRMQLSPTTAIFMFVGESRVSPSGMTQLSDLYKKYKDPDGFLYITYSAEETFG